MHRMGWKLWPHLGLGTGRFGRILACSATRPMPIGFGVFQPTRLSENAKTAGYLGRTGQVGWVGNNQQNQSQKESKDQKPQTTKSLPNTTNHKKSRFWRERNLGLALVDGESLIKEEIYDWRVILRLTSRFATSGLCRREGVEWRLASYDQQEWESGEMGRLERVSGWVKKKKKKK